VAAGLRGRLLGREVVAGSLTQAAVVALQRRAATPTAALRLDEMHTDVCSGSALATWLAHVSSYMASCDASEASTLPSHSPAEASPLYCCFARSLCLAHPLARQGEELHSKSSQLAMEIDT
jgi:hypothetical protein